MPQGPQVAEWEQELNLLVYGLYKLTDKETKIVEKASSHLSSVVKEVWQ